MRLKQDLMIGNKYEKEWNFDHRKKHGMKQK